MFSQTTNNKAKRAFRGDSGHFSHDEFAGSGIKEDESSWIGVDVALTGVSRGALPSDSILRPFVSCSTDEGGFASLGFECYEMRVLTVSDGGDKFIYSVGDTELTDGEVLYVQRPETETLSLEIVGLTSEQASSLRIDSVSGSMSGIRLESSAKREGMVRSVRYLKHNYWSSASCLFDSTKVESLYNVHVVKGDGRRVVVEFSKADPRFFLDVPREVRGVPIEYEWVTVARLKGGAVVSICQPLCLDGGKLAAPNAPGFLAARLAKSTSTNEAPPEIEIHDVAQIKESVSDLAEKLELRREFRAERADENVPWTIRDSNALPVASELLRWKEPNRQTTTCVYSDSKGKVMLREIAPGGVSLVKGDWKTGQVFPLSPIRGECVLWSKEPVYRTTK